MAETLLEWEVVRVVRVWLNRAIAGSRIGIGIAAGTVQVSEEGRCPVGATYLATACTPVVQISGSLECGHGDLPAVFVPVPIPSPLHRLPT